MANHGPSRVTNSSRKALGAGQVGFGDEGWRDYDWTFELFKSGAVAVSMSGFARTSGEVMH